MSICIVVAAALNNVIGKNNRLLWHLPADLRHFKQITSGHTVIMGRKTYESVGRPLPNRRNIIITRGLHTYAGAETASSLDAALSLCAGEEQVYIIGGGEIYREAMGITDMIYMTRVEAAPEGDAYFPEIDEKAWVKTASEHHAADEKNSIPFSFQTFEKRPVK